MDCTADINGDGVVGVNDILLVLQHWGETMEWDLTGDAIIGMADLLVVLSEFSMYC